jgi:hypothetical protein
MDRLRLLLDANRMLRAASLELIEEAKAARQAARDACADADAILQRLSQPAAPRRWHNADGARLDRSRGFVNSHRRDAY